MGAALRVLREQWEKRFGYRPLLAESFTDPEAYAGTCYKASNWEAVGYSAGYSRHRADFYIANDRPKKLWLRPLVPDARRELRAVRVPRECQAGLCPAPSGTLPVRAGEMDSLLEVFRRSPDPRASHIRYRIGPVLTILAMALLAGRREKARDRPLCHEPDPGAAPSPLAAEEKRHPGLPSGSGLRGVLPTASADGSRGFRGSAQRLAPSSRRLSAPSPGARVARGSEIRSDS